MEAHCPQFAVRRVLAQTRRLFVLGFSTTGGGHERISSVLLEYLKGEELKGAAGLSRLGVNSMVKKESI